MNKQLLLAAMDIDAKYDRKTIWERHEKLAETETNKRMAIVNALMVEIKTRITDAKLAKKTSKDFLCVCSKNNESAGEGTDDYTSDLTFHVYRGPPAIENVPFIKKCCMMCHEKTHRSTESFDPKASCRCNHCTPGKMYEKVQIESIIWIEYGDQPKSTELKKIYEDDKPDEKTWNDLLSTAVIRMKYVEHIANLKSPRSQKFVRYFNASTPETNHDKLYHICQWNSIYGERVERKNVGKQFTNAFDMSRSKEMYASRRHFIAFNYIAYNNI